MSFRNVMFFLHPFVKKKKKVGEFYIEMFRRIEKAQVVILGYVPF
jgi:hypothetical protein